MPHKSYHRHGDPDASSRALILKAARILFAEKGYEAATVREIADTAGVNLSLISYHFHGKEGLLRECLEDYIRQKHQIFVRYFTKPPEDLAEIRVKLGMFLAERFSGSEEDLQIFKIFHRECYHQSSPTHELFREKMEINHRLLAEYLGAAQVKKLIKDDVNPFFLASFILGGSMNITLYRIHKPENSGVSIDELASSITASILEGIALK
jgi:AcrR family transcriptional regulator